MPVKGDKIEPIKRFEKKYDIDDNGCWIWNAGHKAGGYGCFYDGNKDISAHQFSFVYFKGPVPKGLEIDHLCEVKNCVNPNHLEAVTHAVNVQRGQSAKINSARSRSKTHCPHGHEYTEQNTYLTRHHKTGSYNRSCKKCREVCVKKFQSAKRGNRSKAKSGKTLI